MDPSEVDAIVQRLVGNPHDEEALAYAHQAGSTDPKSYALLLERVGNETTDYAYAAHWLSEAANVWANALGDAHRAARVLMTAIDKDPTQQVAADRLAQLYRDKGDLKALVALLDRRTKALAPMVNQSPELRPVVAALHEELGRLWNEAPLSQPRKAMDHYKRAAEFDPQSAFAIFSAREIAKSLGLYEDVWPLYQAELAAESDPARRVALLRDEAQTRKAAGDLPGATKALGLARQADDQDPGLQQEFAASILDRVVAGEPVSAEERTVGADALVALAEVYDGEHGLAYAEGALDLDPGNERGLQLYVYYARSLQREDDLAVRYHAYLSVNPAGQSSADAREYLAQSYEAAGRPEDAAAIRDTSNVEREPRHSQSVRPSQGAMRAAEPQRAAARQEEPQEEPRRISALPPDRLQGVLDAAQMLANKGKKPEAYAKYKEVLEADPSHPEALSWVEDYLRTKRDYASLRDVLMASVRAVAGSRESLETRKERLREVAGLCEGNLRDTDGAVTALKQLLAIDRSDDTARQALTRILEKAQRWDDLANLLEQEATAAADLDTKIALEKKLATLQEQKRRDFSAAAEAWSRIARLTPEDDRAIVTAAKLFEKAGQLDAAAQVIADNVASIEDGVARAQLFERLGELREQASESAAAGAAFADAAELGRSAKLWESAERCFTAAEHWDRAGEAAVQRGQLAGEPRLEAQHYARAAEHFFKAGQDESAIERLEQAADLDPNAEEYASALADRYGAQGSWDKLVVLLGKRGDRLADRAKRVSLRRQAATLYASKLGDKEASREMWLKVLDDGDDREALEKLVDYAVEREDHTEATTLLRRLGGIAIDKAEKARVALREAELLAEGVGDIDTAITRYESILTELDATSRPALQAIADLQEARDNHAAAADALERELKLVADAGERGSIAGRLARLYEKQGDLKQAVRALDIVRKADPDDFDALHRLSDLCESLEQWDRVAELLAQRIEVEGDEEEAATMTLRLATILADKLDRGDEALATMTELADLGDQRLRNAYVELGDRLGWKGIVASKLVDWWFDAKSGPERTAALRSAFDRFAEVGRNQDAARVAIEIVRAKGGDKALAQQLEELGVLTSDQDAVFLAQELLLRDTSGVERATELVRQAEVRVQSGMSRTEALGHGEQALGSVPAADAEPLLERLAALAEKSQEVVDLYERQVSRSKQPADRVRALARAAQVAAVRGAVDRARVFFELALTGLPSEETLAALESAASEGDKAAGGEKLRRALCAALAAGGGGARDGGRTRGSLLRRAAGIAQRDLHDVDQAFAWMADALVAYVDPSTLDALEELGVEVGDVARSEGAITHALTEVFDGPLVRQLLARRAKLRRERLDDRPGAASDLKKLHDLSPTDGAVMEELSALLVELGDYRGMVQLYEDQILRGKDMATRAELARKVARMWEEQLQDPREAADAWRRVLRMKAGDAEATSGLDRAKSNMLKKPDPDAGPEAYAPPKAPSQAPPPPAQVSVPTPIHPIQPMGERPAMPTDTASIVAALTDTSETPAGAPTPSHDPDERDARPSDMPTMALTRDDVEALVAQQQHPTPIAPSSPDAPPVSMSTDEHPVIVDFSDETIARAPQHDAAPNTDEDVMVVDDLAEIVEEEPEDPKPRSVPPPLPPRQS